MYIRRVALIFILLTCPVYSLVAQQRAFYDIASKADTYVPVSAEASALFKRTPEAMDYARGRATITIPLYEIRTSSFTLPITLTYTTGGIKVRQPNGPVAVGWTLNAEPMITREVRGLRDEQAYLLDSTYYANNPLPYEARVGEGLKDLLPDFFYYRTLDGGGKFLLDMADKSRFHPRMLSPGFVKLGTLGNVVDGFFQNEISLTDNSGTVYRYGSDSGSREFSDLPDGMSAITTWKASSITSLNGETMSFAYRSNFYREKHYSDYDYYAVEEDASAIKTAPPSVPPTPGYWKGTGTKENYYYYNHSTHQFTRWPGVLDRPYTAFYREVDTRFISSISFQNGSVDFAYDNSSKRLSSVTVRDLNGKQLRKITLCLSDIGYERQLLDSVLIQDSHGTTCQKYEFAYQRGGSYSPYTAAVDKWGYYNGYTGNTDRIPKTTINVKDPTNGNVEYPLTIGGAENTNPNLACASLYSLTSVRYPTGGQTLYSYELNTIYQYPSGPGVQLVRPYSGLRIARIVDLPEGLKGERIVRDFKYKATFGNYITDQGVIRYPDASWVYMDDLKKRYHVRVGAYNPLTVDHDYTLYSQSCRLTNDDTVYYGEVTESVDGKEIKHFYEQVSGRLYTSPYYDDPRKPSVRKLIEEFVNNYYEPYWNSDYLSAGGVHTYYKEGNPVEETAPALSYQSPYLTELKRKMQVVDLTNGSASALVDDSYRNSFQMRTLRTVAMDDKSPATYYAHYTPQGKQSSSDQLSYAQGTGAYRQYRVVGKKTTKTVDGKSYITRYKYPFDFTGEVYERMLQKGAVEIPIEEHRYLEDDLKKIIRYDYEVNPATHSGFALSAVRESTDKACTRFRTTEAYSDYLPAGIPLQVTRRNGHSVCFLWGYNSQYVVAVIENATAQQIRNLLTFTPESLASLSFPEEKHFQELEGLRSRLPEAQVSVYRHAPLQGITQVTGPDNRSLYNEFDRLGRLFRQRDTNGDTLREYQYNEVNK